jgi:two-component system sensor histidine kinase CpxA
MRPGARLMFAFVLVFLSGGACLLLARYLTRPIRTFRETGRQIGGGDLTARIGPAIAGRRDEFGALARDFDQMAARIEALLNAQRRLMRDVSHELRSPLARLQAAVGLIRQKSGDESSPDLDRVDREAENLNALIGEVLQYSRLQDRSDVTRETTDLTELVADVVADARYEGQANGRDVVFEAGEPILADIDPALVHSAIENIVRNALQHSNAKTTVTLTRVDDPAPAAHLEIADDGDGVGDEDLDRIFEPFFTTKTTGAAAGAGIGLAIARRAVELHGGFIRAGKGASGGLVVEVTLPL